MKIRSFEIIKWMGFLGSILIRLWIGTLVYRVRPFRSENDPDQPDQLNDRVIYVFWHENILVPCCHYANRKIQVLISQHADGELIARICQHLGYGTIRGSKTRGGMSALRELIRASQSYDLGVMPDGPRGPRRHIELGLVYLAAKTGLPILLMGVGYNHAWRLNTWDRFVVPRPFSQAFILTRTIHIPKDLTREQMEEYQKNLETTLNELNDHADALASRLR